MRILRSAVLLACFLMAAVASAAEKLNFIVVLTDDQGYQDLGCFGSPTIKTPEIDRMAREGMRFTSFYAGALCSPARVSLLTGCYPKRVGYELPRAVIRPPDTVGLNTDEMTIPEVLKAGGYASMCIGKWHVGHMPKMLPLAQGFDEFYGIHLSNNQGCPLMDGKEEVRDPPAQSEWTRIFTDKAIDFISKRDGKPFFVYLSHIMPHIPLSASEAFRGKSAGGLYGDTIEELDHHTGRLLQFLRDKKLDKNTYVIFTSDNGPYLKFLPNAGSALPLRDGKFSMHEGGPRVPCVMWAPGRIPAGRTSDAVASVMDLLPTFAALADIDLTKVRPATVKGKSGATVPNLIDGHDMRDLLHGVEGAKSRYDEVGLCYFKKRKKGSAPEKRRLFAEAIRLGKWKWYNGALYDLDADIGETTDLSSKHPEIAKRLLTMLTKKDEELVRHMRLLGTE